MRYPQPKVAKHRGFTLIEIMVVVIIIGALMMMAIPGFKAVRERSLVSTFVNDFRAFKEAVNRFDLEEGYLPVDTDGNPDPLFFQYLDQGFATGGTVIGGFWLVDTTSSRFALGVGDYTVSPEVVAEIDDQLDDGDLATGKMQGDDDSFLYVIVE